MSLHYVLSYERKRNGVSLFQTASWRSLSFTRFALESQRKPKRNGYKQLKTLVPVWPVFRVRHGWAGAHQIWGPNWIFAKNHFTFSLGRGVGHVPGEHKPDFRHFQTHSFSENQKIWKSSKYKYIFGPTEVVEILKKSYEFYRNRRQIWAKSMILCSKHCCFSSPWS